MGPIHVFCSQVVSACQSFRPVASFFFPVIVPFLIQKGVWLHRYAFDVPLVTVMLNICCFFVVFFGLAPFFFLLSTIFGFIKYGKGCGHIYILVTFSW